MAGRHGTLSQNQTKEGKLEGGLMVRREDKLRPQ